ncbi:MAG: hypothetical protein DRG30_09980 [Epsilonproteobacteria bacterium]|nr:MAG: hypothetical protein DRG30_09980 [Campylobacterota bacterium]
MLSNLNQVIDNGIIEGYHNKIKMIVRRAFGFRNFENYRLCVKALYAQMDCNRPHFWCRAVRIGTP